MNKTIERERYNEIRLASLPKGIRKQVTNLVDKVTDAAKLDEHGGWDFGSSFDRKGRGYALNWDLYDYGNDFHSKRFLCVIQVRQAFRRAASHYLNVRKSYFLLGRNEDDSVFAHPVESRVIHSAINKGINVIRAVQTWIFNCDYKKVIRHGDLALVPLKRASGTQKDESTIILEKSHRLTAERILSNGNLYALNPELEHIAGVHPKVQAEGWYKVVVGKRSNYWRFASPTID